MEYTIRKIRPEDNKVLANIIRETLEEMDCAIEGTVYTDPSTDYLFQNYQDTKSVYFVAELNGEIVGGSGIAQIANLKQNYCELQKMYLKPAARGTGIAKTLMQKCIDFARQSEYELIYIETFGTMSAAQQLYKKFGFDYIDHSLGDTGHFSCNIKMTLPL